MCFARLSCSTSCSSSGVSDTAAPKRRRISARIDATLIVWQRLAPFLPIPAKVGKCSNLNWTDPVSSIHASQNGAYGKSNIKSRGCSTKVVIELLRLCHMRQYPGVWDIYANCYIGRVGPKQKSWIRYNVEYNTTSVIVNTTLCKRDKLA